MINYNIIIYFLLTRNILFWKRSILKTLFGLYTFLYNFFNGFSLFVTFFFYYKYLINFPAEFTILYIFYSAISHDFSQYFNASIILVYNSQLCYRSLQFSVIFCSFPAIPQFFYFQFSSISCNTPHFSVSAQF